MKTKPHHPAFPERTAKAAILAFPFVFALTLKAASFTEWRQRAVIEVPAAGLIEVALPPDVLDAARPGLEDLRLLDVAGTEVPYLLRRPAAEPPVLRPAKSFKANLQNSSTTLLIETGQATPVNAVTLDTPQTDFIKSVRLEGSTDGDRYTTLLNGVPLFRQAGASELTLRFPAGTWAWLRLTVDDQRSRPVPFTGARVHVASVEALTEPVSVTIKSRDETGGETRLGLDLGAANLALATIELDTPETLFQREVVVNSVEVAEEGLREVEIARGTIYSVNAGPGAAVRRTVLTVERLVRSREVVLLIRNFDSPPLAVSAVRASRRPVQLLFQPRQAGSYSLYVGNAQCPSPLYDLSALSAQLKGAAVTKPTCGPLSGNPDYRAPETLPGLADAAAALDTAPWRFRKPVRLANPGPQQLELDLEVLARARADFADLRLVRDGKQVPYLLERTSLTRALTPSIETANDPKRPQVSRWKITLPHTNLPLTRLECRARTMLFERSVRIWEDVPDGRGGHYARDLGSASWQRTMNSKEAPLAMSLNGRPQTLTLFLETDNGDNPAIELDSFRAFYPATRIVFKSAEAPMLYFGNPTASAPRYDLSLVAGQLLAAERSVATFGDGEVLKQTAWSEGEPLSGVRGWIFWGILALVVVGLLVVIARLLPKPPDTGAPSGSS